MWSIRLLNVQANPSMPHESVYSNVSTRHLSLPCRLMATLSTWLQTLFIPHLAVCLQVLHQARITVSVCVFVCANRQSVSLYFETTVYCPPVSKLLADNPVEVEIKLHVNQRTECSWVSFLTNPGSITAVHHSYNTVTIWAMFTISL